MCVWFVLFCMCTVSCMCGVIRGAVCAGCVCVCARVHALDKASCARPKAWGRNDTVYCTEARNTGWCPRVRERPRESFRGQAQGMGPRLHGSDLKAGQRPTPSGCG